MRVREVVLAGLKAGRRCRGHDARRRRGEQGWQQAHRQGEMAEHVRPELRLEAVGGSAHLDRHDSRVVEEEIDRRVSSPDRVGEGFDRSERAEIERSDL
jgi:hypothetical protein